MANIVDLNLCLFVGLIGSDFKYMKCSNGKQMATFSLCVNSFSKEFADATERTNSQTYIRVHCFDKAQVEYLRKVRAHQGQRVFIISRLSSFKNEHKGITYMTNSVVCRSIMILKASVENTINLVADMVQKNYDNNELSQKAYDTIMPIVGNVLDIEYTDECLEYNKK